MAFVTHGLGNGPKDYFSLAARRPAWINDLQRVWLEKGDNRASPGSVLVDRALARLAEEVCFRNWSFVPF